MFNIGPAELLIIGLVLLIAVGPEQLPGVIRRAGSTVAQFRSMTDGLRSEFMAGLDEIERATDIERWSEQDSDVGKGDAAARRRAATDTSTGADGSSSPADPVTPSGETSPAAPGTPASSADADSASPAGADADVDTASPAGADVDSGSAADAVGAEPPPTGAGQVADTLFTDPSRQPAPGQDEATNGSGATAAGTDGEAGSPADAGEANA